MSLGIDYSTCNEDYLNRYRARCQGTYQYNNNGTDNQANPFETGEQAPTIDVGDNTCTDGQDDGKISFLSKAKNVGEGILNVGKNAVKMAIKHPFKTLAGIGLCCIPVVGPAIGAGFAITGIGSGIKSIVNGIQVASNAQTDAEAKAAWENIGSGAAVGVTSAVALKGSAGLLKGQLTGGSSAVQAVTKARASKASGAGTTTGDIAKTALEEGAKETAGNIGKIGNPIKNKFKKAIEKKAEIKERGFSEVASESWTELKQKSNNKLEQIGDNLKNKIDAKEAKKASNKPDYEFSEEGEPIAKNCEIKKEGKNWELVDKDGTRTIIDKKGKILKKIKTEKGTNGEQITTTYDKNGQEIGKQTKFDIDELKGDKNVKITEDGKNFEIEYKEKDGITTTIKTDKEGMFVSKTESNINKKGTKIETTYDKNDNLIERTIEYPDGKSKTTTYKGNKRTIVEKDKEGKVIKEDTKVANNETHDSYRKTTRTDKDGKKTTEETLTVDNEKIDSKDLLPGQKAAYHIKIKDGKINKILDYQSNILKENTNPFLTTTGVIVNSELEEE